MPSPRTTLILLLALAAFIFAAARRLARQEETVRLNRDRAALALWEKGRPDLLCLDIMMPKRIEPDATAPTIIETVRGAGHRYRPR